MEECGGRAIALAEESGDPDLYITVMGGSYGCFLRGNSRRGIEILDRVIELMDGDAGRGTGLTVLCPLGYAYCFKGGYLGTLGKFDEAQELLELGIRTCLEQGDIESAGWGQMWSSWRCFHAGEREEALRHAQQALELSERTGSPFSRIWSSTFLGGALARLDRWGEAIDALEHSQRLADHHRTAVEGSPARLCWLAESHLGLGDADSATAHAREALEVCRAQGQPAAGAVAELTLARVLLAADPEAVPDEAESLLDSARVAVSAAEYRPVEPLVLIEKGEIARRRGDERAWLAALREARELFAAMGARGHLERLAVNLGEPMAERHAP
jgi:tetratricopeptide (TPR) repeat protein